MATSLDGLGAVAVEVVLADPARRARAERIIDMLFDDVEYVLNFGTEGARLSLQKSVMPAILRSAHTAQKDAEMDALKRDHESIRQMLMGLGAPLPPSAS